MVFIIVLLTFFIFALAIMWRPSTVLAFAVCIYPFEQWAQANMAYFAQNSAIINYGLGLLTLFALACVIMRGQNPLNPTTNAMWVWLALYIYAGLSCLWALDRETSLFLYKYHAPYVITFVALLPLVIQKPDDVRTGLIATLTFGTFVMILLAFDTGIHAWGRTIEVEHGVGVVDRVGQSRTRLAPLSVAETAGQLIIIATLMNFIGLNRVWQIARWVVVFIALALIYRSGSRGQFFAAAIAVMIFIAPSRGLLKARGWVTASASIAVMLAVSAFTFTAFADTSGRWSLERMSDTLQATRIDYCITLLNFWADSSPIHWLFGIGSSSSYDPRILGIYCHVVIVEILAELGIVGFCLITAFVLLVCRDGYQLYKATKGSNVDRGTAVALCGLFLFQLILTFKERSFLSHTFTLSVGLMICRYCAVVKSQKKRERSMAMRQWAMQQTQLQQQQAARPLAHTH